MTWQRTPARIGSLFFKYDDPDVDVRSEANTVEHETIDDEIVVQVMGRRADRITVTTVVADYETYMLDDLVKLGTTTLRTERWQGDVLVESVSSTARRQRDTEGRWLHEAQINCIEVEEDEYIGDDSPAGAQQASPSPNLQDPGRAPPPS